MSEETAARPAFGTETVGTIEIRIAELAQLFNSLDPSPFRERDLDSDAEEHIVSWARELPSDQGLRLRIHLPAPEAAKARERRVGEAIGNYFTHRGDTIEREMQAALRTGWRFLALGLSLLAVCMTSGFLVRRFLLPEPYGAFVAEGLTILGWVANWRPIEILLYDRLETRRRLRLYRSLAAAEIVVVER